MNQISQALSQGFTASQIIQYLSRHFPKHSKQIQKAISQGFTAEQVLGYLGNGRKGINNSEGELTEHEKTRKGDKDAQRNLEKGAVKGALTAGALALGAYGLSRGGQSAGQAITGQILPALQGNQPQPQLTNTQRTLPFNPQNSNPIQPSPSPAIGMQVQQQAQQPINNLMQNQNQNIPNPPIQQQTTNAQTPPIDYNDIVSQIGIKDRIDTMRQNNDPETVSKLIKYTLNKNQIREIEKGLNTPIESIVKGYIENNPIEQETINNEEIEEDNLPFQKPEKGWMVALPDGSIGQIEDVKKQISKINVNGKERHVKSEDLIRSPLPEKDMADLFEDVLSGIQKQTGQEVSRNVYWAGYDPKTNELAYIPHLGALYVYDNISPEDSEQLTNLLTQRKSTGQNHIGAWEKGTNSPIGAAMYQLIQKLQKERGGKGNEYSGKFQKIYDALEPAHQAKKDKKKKEQDMTRNEKPKRKTKKSGTD